MEDQFAVFLGSSLRLAMPLILAAAGELVSERAGVLNLSLEGMMLTAAFAGAFGSWASGSPTVGVLCGLAAVMPVAALQGLLSVKFKANQLVVGIGINILALGATTLLYREIFGPLSREIIPGLPRVHVPFLGDLPVLGRALFHQVPLVYVGFAVVAAIGVALRFTSWGLAVTAVGENPRAADQAGISVPRVRFVAVLIAGAMAGLAGVFISVGDIHTFTENMTNGAGYIAIVAVIFGGWKMIPTIGACLLFGAATALQFQFPDIGVPTALLIMLPYLLALFVVAGLISRNVPPSALTMPYQRGG